MWPNLEGFSFSFSNSGASSQFITNTAETCAGRLFYLFIYLKLILTLLLLFVPAHDIFERIAAVAEFKPPSPLTVQLPRITVLFIYFFLFIKCLLSISDGKFLTIVNLGLSAGLPGLRNIYSPNKSQKAHAFDMRDAFFFLFFSPQSICMGSEVTVVRAHF